MTKKAVVYDIEVMINCFVYCDIDINSNQISKFVVHDNQNDISLLINHLESVALMIGYNNINFDYPVLHRLLTNKSLFQQMKPFDIIKNLYVKGQQIIAEGDDNSAKHEIREKDIIISQIDLLKIWHFNNPNKRTKLKILQCAMRWDNVVDMPYKHDEFIDSNQLKEIVDYCVNDVMSTFEFYKITRGKTTLPLYKDDDKIAMRMELGKKYGINLINADDPKIGADIVLKLYCDKTKQNIYSVKDLRTFTHEKIKLKDVIFDYITFKSKEFKAVYDFFSNSVINGTKNQLKNIPFDLCGDILKYAEKSKDSINIKKKQLRFPNVVFNNFRYDFGLGGIHGSISGIFKSDNDYIIRDADVTSLYPSIAVKNSLYPSHLGLEFCDVYANDVLATRLIAKKAGNKVVDKGLKLGLNGTYGKSKDRNSYLYDPLYTMKTTVNGQLMLAMLAEQLHEYVEDLQVLQVNTDGITVRMPRNQADNYNKACKIWEEFTKLQLEFVDYDKMIIRDVNNYMAITTTGKIKHKGCFEIDKEIHKDDSFRIIPIAISEFFKNNTPIETTIKNNTDIFNFCGRNRVRHSDNVYSEIRFEDNTKLELQEINRYYISKKGATFVKIYKDDNEEEAIEKGYKVTIFNKFESKSIEDYDLDYNYYIEQANSIIDAVSPKTEQLSMLFGN